MDYSEKGNAAEIQTAIEAAYVKYRPKLITYIRTGVSGASVVEDILQEVFLTALKKYDVFEDHPNQLGWLYKTASFKIKEYQRKMQELDMLSIDDEMIEVGDEEYGYLETELDMFAEETLTEEERKCYFRYFHWGYSVEEIAALEGVTVNNMRVRLCRIKKKLLQQAKLQS